MKNLTKREKVLLYILACVIIFSSALYLFILPTVREINDLSGKIDAAKITELEMKLKIQNDARIQENISKTKEEIKTAAAAFYPLMANDQIGSLVSDILLKNNLIPQKVNISDTENAAFPALNTNNFVYIKKCYVSVKVTGTPAELSNIIDEVNSRKSIRISAFAVNDSLGNMDQAVNISIDFEVFMYDAP